MKNASKLAAISVLALTVTAITAGGAAARPAEPRVTALVGEPVQWGPCLRPGVDPRQRCAKISVPQDYRNTSGAKIDVAISRIIATDAKKRRGVLLLNPGGPGGSGLDLPSAFARLMPAEVLARYDLIGFDPRGVGESTPVTCGISNPNGLETKVIPYPAPNGDISGNISFAQQLAADCNHAAGPALKHITTANTARDMDRIRVALGEKKISYLGYSYGTYLGAVYANLFPRQTDRIVLDSAVDPTRVWREVWNAWGRSVAERAPDFFKWVAARDGTYHLGQTAEQVHALYFELAGRLDRKPVKLPDGTVVDGNFFREYTRSVLYSDDSFPEGATNWQLIKQMTEGGLRAKATTKIAALPPVDSGLATLEGIICNDTRWRVTAPQHARDVQKSRARWPLTSGMPANIWPCVYWPVKAGTPVKITNRGPANILIPQNRRDPATPYFGAKNLRRLLGDRARMVITDAGGHGTYLQAHNSCADAATTRFLVTGELPDADIRCGASKNADKAVADLTPAQKQALAELRRRMYPL